MHISLAAHPGVIGYPVHDPEARLQIKQTWVQQVLRVGSPCPSGKPVWASLDGTEFLEFRKMKHQTPFQ